MSAEQVARINSATKVAFADPTVAAAMEKQGNVINPSTPAEAAAYFKSETKQYGELAKRIGLQAD